MGIQLITSHTKSASRDGDGMPKLSARIVKKATGYLHAEEVPVASGIAQIGRVSVAQTAAVAVAGVLVGALTGVYGYRVQEGYFALLTNERILFLKSNGLWGPTKKLHGEVPLAPLSVADVRWGWWTKVTLAVQGETQGILLKTHREFATSLIAALGAPTA
jgi:hypothetical protein